MAAAARRIEPEHVVGAQRIVGIACRQPLRLLRLRIDPDRAGPAGRAAGAAVRRDHVLHRADREPRVGEVEIFAANAEAAAELAGTTGIRDQLETNNPGWKLALDDLDRRDLGVALVDGDAGHAVLGGTGA